MRKSRRKTVTRILEGVAVGLVLLDVVLYFALVRPLRSMRSAEQARYSATRERIRELTLRAARLEKFQTALPEKISSALSCGATFRRAARAFRGPPAWSGG
jgi:type II secretory pathway component PulM